MDLLKIHLKHLYFAATLFMAIMWLINLSDKDANEPVITGYGEGLFEIDELIYWDDFQHLNNWDIQVEKSDHEIDTQIDIRNGKLNVLVPNRGATIWFRHKIKGPVAIVYKVTAPSKYAHLDQVIPRDINAFFHASDPEIRWDIFNHERYTGAFPTYHKQHGYYASIGGSSNTTTRFRRYPRTSDGEPVEHISLNSKDNLEEYLIHADSTHTIQLVAYDDVIQYIVDGRVFYEIKNGDTVNVERANGKQEKYEYTSDRFPPYTEGWFGFRLVRTHHVYSDFRVYSLKPSE